MGQDSERFAELIKAYAAPVRRLCSVYASLPADREDLFQSIFLALWRALPGFRGEASERTWMYRIAHNVALTWRAADRRRKEREEPLTEETPGGPSPEWERIALAQAVSRLTPADRTVTVLWLEGLSAAEIGEVIGVNAAAVAMRLSRVRRQLAPPEVKI